MAVALNIQPSLTNTYFSNATAVYGLTALITSGGANKNLSAYAVCIGSGATMNGNIYLFGITVNAVFAPWMFLAAITGNITACNYMGLVGQTQSCQTVIPRDQIAIASGTGFTLRHTADSTRRVQFDLSNITTGTTRTLTLPDTNDTVVTLISAQTLQQKYMIPRTGTTATGTTITPTVGSSGYDIYTVTALASDATIAVPSGTVSNTFVPLSLRIKDNGTARALTWNAIYRFPADIIAPTTTVVGATLYVQFRWNLTDSKWDCVSVNGGAAISTSGISRTVVNVTTTTTLSTATSVDYLVFIGSGGVVTLPTAVSNTSKYTLKNTDTSSKTIATTSSQTIEGTTTYTINPGISIDVVSDGSNWRIV